MYSIFDNYYVILSTRVLSGKVRLSIVKIIIKNSIPHTDMMVHETKCCLLYSV